MRTILFILIFLNAFGVSADVSVNRYEFKTNGYSVSSPGYHVTHQELEHTQLVTFNGLVLLTTDKKGLDKLYQKLIPGKDIDLFIYTSMGGVTSTYRSLVSHLRNSCPKGACRITTYVQRDCGSACIELFLNGDHRILGKFAKMRFHREWAGLGPIEIPIQSRAQFKELYTGLGVHEDWMTANLSRLTSDQRNGVFLESPELLIAGFADEIDDGTFQASMSQYLPEEFSLPIRDGYSSLTREQEQKIFDDLRGAGVVEATGQGPK